MPVLGNNYFTNNIRQNQFIDSKYALHYLLFRNMGNNIESHINKFKTIYNNENTLFSEDHRLDKKTKVKLVNWYVYEYSNLERFIICKCKLINNKIIFLMFNYYYYYLCDEELLNSNSNLSKLKNNIDKYKCGKYIIINNKIISSEYKIINDKELETYNNIDNDNYKKLYLFMTNFKINIHSDYNHSFFDYRWFFTLNNIDVSGTYEIDLKKLKKINIKSAVCLYNNDINIFDTKIESYLTDLYIVSLDIECFHYGIFPTPDKYPISHISFEIINTKVKKILVFFNIDRIFDIKKSIIENDVIIYDNNIFTYNDCANILNSHHNYIGTSEINILIFTQYILKTNPDYILTYNGHNFDFEYIIQRNNRLHLDELCIHNLFNMETLKFKKLGSNTKIDVMTENNNNTGIIFLDLYNFLKKNKKFSRYKLADVSKEIIKINAICKWNNYECEIYPVKNDKDPDAYILFYNAIRSANYCFIDDLPYEIIDKKNIFNGNLNNLYDKEDINKSLGKSFLIKATHSNIIDKTKTNIVVNISKDDVDISDKNIYNNYNYSKAINIAKYCIHDTILCRLIFERESVDDIVTSFSSLRFLPQKECFNYNPNINVNGLFLDTLLKLNTMIKGNINCDIIEYEGGRVFDPIKKYIKGPIMIFDFVSLYPTVIIEGNISPEKIVCVLYVYDIILAIKVETIIHNKYPYPTYMMCKIEKKTADNKLYYIFIVTDKREDGFITKLLKLGIDLRNKYKKLLSINKNITHLKYLYNSLQYAVKIYINSIYGLLACPSFILSSPLCAQMCTAIARNSIQYVYDIIHKSSINNNVYEISNDVKKIFLDTYIKKKYVAENLDNCKLECVYGDTDSLFINIIFENQFDEDNLIKKANNVGKYLESIINTDEIFTGIYNFQFESLNMYMIISAKKKYICMQFFDSISKLYIKGLSLIRSDYSRFHKLNLQYLLEHIIDSIKNNNITNMDNVIVDFITKIIEYNINNILFLNYNDFILTIKYSGKYKNEYELERIVREYNIKNPNNKIKPGERISYIYGEKIIDTSNINILNKKLLTNVLQQIIIIDDNFNFTDIRLSLEIYINRLLNDIETFMINKDILIKYIKKIF